MQLHPDFRDVFNAGRNSFHVASSEGRNLQTQKYLWKFQVRTLRKPAAVSATGAEEDEQLETMAVAEPEMEVEEQKHSGSSSFVVFLGGVALQSPVLVSGRLPASIGRHGGQKSCGVHRGGKP